MAKFFFVNLLIIIKRNLLLINSLYFTTHDQGKCPINYINIYRKKINFLIKLEFKISSENLNFIVHS